MRPAGPEEQTPCHSLHSAGPGPPDPSEVKGSSSQLDSQPARLEPGPLQAQPLHLDLHWSSGGQGHPQMDRTSWKALAAPRPWFKCQPCPACQPGHSPPCSSAS